MVRGFVLSLASPSDSLFRFLFFGEETEREILSTLVFLLLAIVLEEVGVSVYHFSVESVFFLLGLFYWQ
jgi:hypothetical protein